MGRRGIGLEEADRWVFNRLAEAYRHRAGYPAALVERLAALVPPESRTIVDLGAGTGHLALPLAERGLAVTAVEPARAMLEELARTAAERSLKVEVVHAAAEQTRLAGGRFGLVLFADVVQWVDPELAGREAGRLRAPGGACAVVEAELGGNPFMDGLLALVAEANPRARPRAEGPVRQLLAHAVPGVRPAVERFIQEEVVAEEALLGTLRSLSFVGPALAPEVQGRLLEAARRLAREQGGARWRRELILSWAAGAR